MPGSVIGNQITYYSPSRTMRSMAGLGADIGDPAGEADLLFNETEGGVEPAGVGVEGAGVQGEVGEAVVARPGVGGGDERPADAAPGRAVGNDQLADVAVALAGEMGARSDADHPGDPVPVGGHEDGAVPVLRRVERFLQPAPPG